jgi:hypothetical protein
VSKRYIIGAVGGIAAAAAVYAVAFHTPPSEFLKSATSNNGFVLPFRGGHLAEFAAAGALLAWITR